MIALGSLARHQSFSIQRVSYIHAVSASRALVDPDSVRMALPLIQNSQHTDEKYALVHYNKAINELATRINNYDMPIEVVLLACILFVSLEFLRGDVQPALKHFKSG